MRSIWKNKNPDAFYYTKNETNKPNFNKEKGEDDYETVQ